MSDRIGDFERVTRRKKYKNINGVRQVETNLDVPERVDLEVHAIRRRRLTEAERVAAREARARQLELQQQMIADRLQAEEAERLELQIVRIQNLNLEEQLRNLMGENAVLAIADANVQDAQIAMQEERQHNAALQLQLQNVRAELAALEQERQVELNMHAQELELHHQMFAERQQAEEAERLNLQIVRIENQNLEEQLRNLMGENAVLAIADAAMKEERERRVALQAQLQNARAEVAALEQERDRICEAQLRERPIQVEAETQSSYMDIKYEVDEHGVVLLLDDGPEEPPPSRLTARVNRQEQIDNDSRTIGINSTARVDTIIEVPLERINNISTIREQRDPDRAALNYSLISEGSIDFGSPEANSSILGSLGSATNEALKNISV